MLVRLPNRDWLDLREVTGVHYQKDESGLPVVLIRLRGGGAHLESFPDEEAARLFRDTLGMQCNGAVVDPEDS